MALYINRGGTTSALAALYTQKNGAMQTVATAYTAKNGALTPLFSEGSMLGELPVGDTVRIPEGDTYATYRIWQKDYAGTNAVLLLREHLLSTPMALDAGTPLAYTDSALDAYLQTEYVQSLSVSLQNKLVSVPLPTLCHTVDGDSAVESAPPRSCFLLSLGELCDPPGYGAMPSLPMDGTPLAYYNAQTVSFGNGESPRIACDGGGTPRAWWLRSAYPYERSTPMWSQFVCTAEGYVSHTAAKESRYVRPALAVDERYIPE